MINYYIFIDKFPKDLFMQPIISFCIPTNGISEWVFPVLNSIYSQNVSKELFEVIVTDNGNNTEFEDKILLYKKNHINLIYKKTNSIMFQNQIDSLRLANGLYLKFVNHRAVLENGSLEWMLNQISNYKDEKPIIYFSNGVFSGKHVEYDTFDSFVNGLKEYASWTTGVGVWKEDFEKIPVNHIYNKISPHSDVLFAVRNRNKYIIDDNVWSHNINSQNNKGFYDLYKAFGCEELTITLTLLIDGDISAKTFKNVKRAYKKLLVKFYLQFNILKIKCSYDLSGFNDSMGIFFSKSSIIILAYLKLPNYLLTQAITYIKNIIKKIIKK